MATETAYSPRSTDSEAKEKIARFARLKSEREGFYDNAWQSAAEWMMPRKSSLWESNIKTPGENGWVDNIFDITAMTANERLAAWLMTSTSPASSRWFGFNSPPKIRRQWGGRVPWHVSKWWQEVTQVTLEELHLSNFYTAKHESVLDRNTFGTCALFPERGRRTSLNFRNLEVATYVIDNDPQGNIDTVIYEFKLTTRRAVQEFGVEALGEKILKAWRSNKAEDRDKEWCFYHAIEPNVGRNPQYDDAQNKPWRSCYVSKEDEKIVREGGFDEMPIAVSRFLKWVGDKWGWAPAMTALPCVRETNFFKEQMNALAEKAAFPPILEPSNLAGQVDSRAGGRTVFDENLPAHALPQEWQTAGRFDIAEKLLESNREFINTAFYGDVVALFTNLEREITAFEAAQLAGEKIDVFSPYYFRLINELDTPILQNTFAILLKEGYYPDPPEEVLTISPDGSSAFIDMPEVVYLSRLALAIQSHEIAAFDQFLARGEQLATIDPGAAREWMRTMNLHEASRGFQNNLSLPVGWQRTDEEIEQIAAAEKQQAEAMAAAEAAPKAAKAIKDLDQTSSATKQRMAQLAS